MSDPENQEGRVIAERYRLTALLGQGGMGSVWRAEHLTLGSEVAIKLINADVAGNEEIRARFVREAKAAAGLRSPHVVQILDYGVDGDTPYIAMELMEGESLSERLDREKRLSLEETSNIITQIARALSKAHDAGIIHRDLKPDNIFLVRNDDSEIAKVLDFGVAKQVLGTENAHMTTTGAVMGTPYYMSPEQAEGAKTLDHRTDIWALAVIAYECILGVRPFDATTLGGLFMAICARDKPVPSRVSVVPAGFDEWFHRGTARDVSVRYENARVAAHALREICEAERVSALPGTPMPQTQGAPRTQHAGTGGLSTQVSRDAKDNSLAGSRTAASPHAQQTEGGQQVTSGAAQPVQMPAEKVPPQYNPHLTTGGASAIAVPLKKSNSNKTWVLGLSAVALIALAWLGITQMGKSQSSSPLATGEQIEEDQVASGIIQATPPEPDQPAPPKIPEVEAKPEEPDSAVKEEESQAEAAAPKPKARPTVRRPAPKRRVSPRPQPKPQVTPHPKKTTTPTPEKKTKPPTKRGIDLGI